MKSMPARLSMKFYPDAAWRWPRLITSQKIGIIVMHVVSQLSVLFARFEPKATYNV
jgi:hypothetical protein